MTKIIRVTDDIHQQLHLLKIKIKTKSKNLNEVIKTLVNLSRHKTKQIASRVHQTIDRQGVKQNY